jgi:hypothetical protein
LREKLPRRENAPILDADSRGHMGSMGKTLRSRSEVNKRRA